MLAYLTNRLQDLQTQVENEPSAVRRISLLSRIAEVLREINLLLSAQ